MNISDTLKKRIIISGISVLAIFTVIITMFIFAVSPLKKQLSNNKTENKSLNTQIKDVNTKNNKLTTDLKTANDGLAAANSELAVLKSDITAKQVEMDKINAETEKVKAEAARVKTDLATQTASLEKAKKNLAKLSELDTLFVRYDSQSNELADMLTRYYEALENGDYSSANQFELTYESKIATVEATYKRITQILTDFRNNK